MFDELNVDGRMCIDPMTNLIVGPCQEHVGGTSVEFESENKVYLLMEALEKGKVHMAVDVHGT